MTTAPHLPDLTLPQMLRRRAAETPDHTAVRQKDFGIWHPLTWAQYHQRCRNFGLGLGTLGLPERPRIGVLSDNRVEWVIAQHGTNLSGGVAVGVYATSPANEVAYILGHGEVDAVVCEDQEQTDKVLETLAELPRVRRVIVIEQKGLRAYPRDLVVPFAEVEAAGAAAPGDAGAALDRTLDAQTLDDIGLTIYTSGSTGRPKGAMLSYRNMRAEAIGLVERLGLDAASTGLSYLPLCHVAEQMLTNFAPIYVGSTVNFGESIRTVQDDLREVAPTHFLGVPRIWEKLHAAITIKMIEAGGARRWLFDRAFRHVAPDALTPPARRPLGRRLVFGLWYLVILRALQNAIGLGRARLCLTGAAPIAPGIVAFFRTLGLPFIEVYGLTESTGMITGQRLDHLVPGSVGPPIEGAEVRLGAHGELEIRGDAVFAGYYRNPDATAATIRDGWLATGDVAALETGEVRIIDRLKDIMITAGGKNLSPSEIENTVKASPFIKECIALGEGRRFVSALIQIDPETVGSWAETRRLPFTNFRSLAENPAVHQLVADEVDAANHRLARVAQIRKFHLLTKELDHDDDEVTATMKVRRANIHRKYQAEIDALYAG